MEQQGWPSFSTAFTKLNYSMRIKSIEHSTEVKTVYDIMVTGEHHYVANGFVSHNSITSSQLAINAANLGYKALIVPLEMSKWQMTARIIANVCNVDLTEVLQQKLSTNDKERVYKKYRKWVKKNKAKGGRYTIFKPPGDMTIEEIMAAIAAFNCDIVIIDYISLLKGMDGDDQWRALGAAARYAKINAENMDRVNVLVCQVSEEGKIRYSRAVTEHSSNSWIWNSNAEIKETGIVKVEQPKSRNSESFPFYLHINYPRMQVKDAPMDEAIGAAEEENEKEKKKKRKDKIPNLATTDL